MKKKLFTTFYIFLLAFFCSAQPEEIKNISQKVSIENLRNNLFYLCSEPLQGRLTATNGDTLASLFIADWFKKTNLKAPYDNGKRFFQSVKMRKSVVEEGVLTINDKNYSYSDGWGFWPQSFPMVLSLQEVPVIFLGHGHVNAYRNDLNNLDITGKPVIKFSSQLKDSAGNYISSGTKTPTPFHLKSFKENGVSLFFAPRPFDQRLQQSKIVGPTNPYHGKNYGGRDSIGSLIITNKLLNDVLSKDGVTLEELVRSSYKKIQPFMTKSTMSIKVKIKEVDTEAPNVIGIIEGTDSSTGYVVVTAHHDHDGMTEQGVRYGAVDNASGTVALMEMVLLFNDAIKQGFRPKRSILFLSTTGEEVGLLGSEYYVEHPVYPLQQIWAVMNLDMLGARDTIYEKQPLIDYVYATYSDSLKHGIETGLNKANEFLRMKIDTSIIHSTQFRRSLSDAAPFYAKGIPVLSFHVGETRDYHEVTDTPDKVDFALLRKHTQLAFLSLWNLAND